MILKYTTKQVYGNTLIYPACATSESFLKALGLKVFTPASIAAARALGCTLEQVMEAVAI